MQTDAPVCFPGALQPNSSEPTLTSGSGEVFVLLLLRTDCESAESPALDDVTTAATL